MAANTTWNYTVHDSYFTLDARLREESVLYITGKEHEVSKDVRYRLEGH